MFSGYFRFDQKICKDQKIVFYWLNGNTFVTGAGDMRFKSQGCQIVHNDANGSPLLQHFFQKSCVAWAQ